MSTINLSAIIDNKLTTLSSKYGNLLLKLSIGMIYIWFGVLKFFPGLSPAEKLAGDTLSTLTLHMIDQEYLIWILAAMELAIGLGLVLWPKSKALIFVVFIHMMGTLTPMFFFPELVFNTPPFGFSIVGQYIMKNFVIISALIMAYSKRS